MNSVLFYKEILVPQVINTKQPAFPALIFLQPFHRAENTDNPKILKISSSLFPGLIPLWSCRSPANCRAVRTLISVPSNVIYHRTRRLSRDALAYHACSKSSYRLGGLQKEAISSQQCNHLRTETEWVEPSRQLEYSYDPTPERNT